MAREVTVRLSVADNFSQQLRAFASAIDGDEKALTRMGRATHETQGRLGAFNNMLGQLGLAVTAAGIVRLGGEIIGLGVKMEQTEIAFETLTGSVDAAQEHLNALRDFAAQTPFQFSELTEASKRLQAYGFAAQDVLPMLRDIGDATAALGTGAFGIDRVTRALGQMQTRGKVASQEMLQMTEAGIPAWRYLAENMDTTTAAVQKMVEKGLVPADEGIQAILTGMRQDFGGLMARQAQTAGGALSNLRDELERVGTQLGREMTPQVHDAAVSLTELAHGFQTFITVAGGGFWSNVDRAWEQHIDDVRRADLTYEQYAAEVDRSNIALGRFTIRVADNTGEITQQALETGRLTREQFEAVRAAEYWGDEEEKLRGRMETTTGAVIDQAEADKALKKAMDEAYDSFKLLIDTAQDMDRENESFTEKQSDLTREINETSAKIRELIGAQGDNKTAIDEQKAKLDELTAKYDENAAEHERATHRILFGFIEQKLAADGWTQEEIKFLADVGKAWGIYSEDTAQALEDVGKALYDSNLDASNFLSTLAELDGQKINVTVTTHYRTTGEPSPEAGDIGLPGGPGPETGSAGSAGTTPSEPETVYGNQLQHGGSFTVPPGFWHDNYRLGVSSGEQVSVTPAGATTNNATTIFNIDARGSTLSAPQIERLVRRVLAERDAALDARLRTG